jgi:hypothetical protein
MKALLSACYFGGISVLLFACGNPAPKPTAPGEEKMSKPALQMEIGRLEAGLFKSKSLSPDTPVALKVVALYEDYVMRFAGDSLCPKYLFKAGELSLNAGKPQQAIRFFKILSDRYTTSAKAPYALFLQGFIYETKLNSYGKASELYETILRQHPAHQAAKDAAACLRNMGQSDQELIRQFEKKAAPTPHS